MGLRVNKLLRFVRGHAPDIVALSARLDGQLGAPAAARLDEHLASCEACRRALDGLRTTREALRTLPELDSPRSFRLRAADVERLPIMVGRPTAPLSRWAPAVGAVAAAVFVVVLAADLRSSGSGPHTASAPRAARQGPGAESNDGTGLATGKSAPSAGATPAAGIAAAPVASAADASNADRAPAAAAPLASGASGATNATPAAAAQASEAYAATAAADGRPAAAPPATAQSGSLAAAAADNGDEDDGNNSRILRVIEIIAAATALSAAAVVIVWRRRGERA